MDPRKRQRRVDAKESLRTYLEELGLSSYKNRSQYHFDCLQWCTDILDPPPAPGDVPVLVPFQTMFDKVPFIEHAEAKKAALQHFHMRESTTAHRVGLLVNTGRSGCGKSTQQQVNAMWFHQYWSGKMEDAQPALPRISVSFAVEFNTRQILQHCDGEGPVERCVQNAVAVRMLHSVAVWCESMIPEGTHRLSDFSTFMKNFDAEVRKSLTPAMVIEAVLEKLSTPTRSLKETAVVLICVDELLMLAEKIQAHRATPSSNLVTQSVLRELCGWMTNSNNPTPSLSPIGPSCP